MASQTWQGWSHHNFRKVVWLKSYGQSFIECIQTEEYMHVYNAIIVLKEILPVFPLAAVADFGPTINAAVDSLLEKESRGDLKILGKAYVMVGLETENLDLIVF